MLKGKRATQKKKELIFSIFSCPAERDPAMAVIVLSFDF